MLVLAGWACGGQGADATASQINQETANPVTVTCPPAGLDKQGCQLTQEGCADGYHGFGLFCPGWETTPSSSLNCDVAPIPGNGPAGVHYCCQCTP
jgi:hypothetical protein